jgi:hypothetical protein
VANFPGINEQVLAFAGYIFNRTASTITSGIASSSI